MDHGIPFDFADRVPLVRGTVNGRDFARFLLDTGAPSSWLHRDVAVASGLSPDADGTVHVDSLGFGTLDLGPVELKVGSFGENRVDGLLGTRELLPYRVMLDLDQCICVLGQSSCVPTPSSPLEIYRARPVVRVHHARSDLTFVLDTGSSGNWLFAPGQDKLRHVGAVEERRQTAKTAWGDSPVRRAKVLDNMAIGGQMCRDVCFLLSEPEQFGGVNAPEDGILGLGAIASSGRAIIDFPLGRFVLAPGDKEKQPSRANRKQSGSS